jgi:hypothetical protein
MPDCLLPFRAKNEQIRRHDGWRADLNRRGFDIERLGIERLRYGEMGREPVGQLCDCSGKTRSKESDGYALTITHDRHLSTAWGYTRVSEG